MGEWTTAEYAAHYKGTAEKYRDAAILIRGDLTAWKHERSVQADSDRECEVGPSPDYYRADGAINAINHLASKADQRRRDFEELAAAAESGDMEALNKKRAELRR